jgi:hypothetical protein
MKIRMTQLQANLMAKVLWFEPLGFLLRYIFSVTVQELQTLKNLAICVQPIRTVRLKGA